MPRSKSPGRTGGAGERPPGTRRRRRCGSGSWRRPAGRLRSRIAPRLRRCRACDHILLSEYPAGGGIAAKGEKKFFGGDVAFGCGGVQAARWTFPPASGMMSQNREEAGTMTFAEKLPAPAAAGGPESGGPGGDPGGLPPGGEPLGAGDGPAGRGQAAALRKAVFGVSVEWLLDEARGWEDQAEQPSRPGGKPALRGPDAGISPAASSPAQGPWAWWSWGF